NGQSLTESFTAVSSDGSASHTATVTIHGTNDLPVIAGVASGDVSEDVAVDGSGNLTAAGALTIADPDLGQSNFTAQAATAGTYGTFTLDAAGNCTYAPHSFPTPRSSDLNGQSLTESFTAVSSD